MKNILVTGLDSFVGAEVCGALLKRNHSVRGAQWKAGALPERCESVVVGNIHANTDWQIALKDAGRSCA